MKSKIVFAVVLFLAASVSAIAQSKFKIGFDYNVSVPVGSFKNDYISKPSFRGGTGELSYTINPSFSVGVATGYQSYYERYDRQLYKLSGNQTISAVVTNNMDVVPVLLRAAYKPFAANSSQKVQPYLLAGAGINMISYGQYLGSFGGSSSSTSFAAQAGLGVQIPVGNKVNETVIKIGGTYNYVAYKENGLSNLNNVGINAGIAFRLR